MGVKVIRDMPGHFREAGNVCGKKYNELYWLCKRWVEGEDVDVGWEGGK